MTSFADYVSVAAQPSGLSEQQMVEAMEIIMDGSAPADQLSRFLTVLAERGETVAEITGAARVLRAKASAIDAPDGTLDCCGTGGDGAGTYNVSTAVAFVVASCGVPVAKHGNRAASSKSGAADTLEALGVNLDLEKEKLEEGLRAHNFCFLMAPRHHAAIRHVMPVRKALGFRTVFNLLGPLANPANAKFQLLGVYDRRWVLPMAQTLQNLGARAAWVVHGADGLDEITVTGPTSVARLANGSIEESMLSPGDFGLSESSAESLKGGTAQDNAKALRDLLGGAPGAYRDIVIANAAAALNLCGKAPSLKDAAATAAEAIDSGAALAVLDTYAAFSRSPA